MVKFQVPSPQSIFCSVFQSVFQSSPPFSNTRVTDRHDQFCDQNSSEEYTDISDSDSATDYEDKWLGKCVLSKCEYGQSVDHQGDILDTENTWNVLNMIK